MGGASKLTTVAVYFGSLAAVVSIWITGSAKILILEGSTGAEMYLVWGRLLGILGFFFILWQMLLIGRVGWIEKAWGHDRLSRIHHTFGITAVLTILLHPIFILLAYSDIANLPILEQLKIFLTQYPGIVLALIAYLMFIGIVLMSINLARKRLRYEIWYFIHFTLYLAIIFSFLHQIRNGEDLAREWARYIWWGFIILVFANVLYYRFLRPAWRFWYHGFHITETRQETENVTSVSIGGKHLEKLKAKAGQFIIVRFLAPGFWWEAHPFSLSEVPNEKRFRLSIKNVGDFTKKIPTLKVGTRVLLEGPLGIFTPELSSRNKILLIAGGIGITPIRSIFEKLAEQGKDIKFFYANKTRSDIALKSELEEISNRSGAEITHILSDESDYSGEKGYVDEEKIKRLVPDIMEREVYLCGPPPMMKIVNTILKKLGLPKKYIHFEKFSLG